ncbi:SDR family NAD(P)-dependent oxidoreductase [Pseudomonas viridiflava]|uniref:SDR family NAD(P)-dependent oxidoreductase n=1 Tax=Pseudomonas viridiflava TaxID=33069 RepID=UPI000F035FBE|nr:glucose 1-dehydrogenase [Pseudomonas viridiflava]
MNRLHNKVVLVTGGGMGIGRAIAELFAEEGATVIVGDVHQPEPYKNDSVVAKHLDVSKLEDWELLVAEVVREYGKVDVLVNNAGLVGSYLPIDEISLNDWNRVIDVNQNGVFYGMRTVIPFMKRQQAGSIVNVSSIWGIVGASGVSAYQASKAAVRMMSKNAALSYVANGIRVNSLHPGLVATPMIDHQAADITAAVVAATPMKRAADPKEIAYAALFLASDEASFITGAELAVDGGYTTP